MSKHRIRKTYDDFVQLALLKGYKTLSLKEEFHTTKTKMTISDGTYLYSAKYENLKAGKIPAVFHPTNPYTIQNINTYLRLYKNDVFICISTQYINEHTELEFICNRCNDVFSMKWINAYRKDDGHYGISCPNCDGRIESLHACVLKQIFKHEYNDTILEEKSCINPRTGNILPTDIVNHRLKIAIEIQSQYHDKTTQKIKDSIKKDFWINNGYSFYDPDIRDYNIIQMIQLFFPNMTNIPEYVDLTYSNKLNIIEIQKLLNKNYSPKEISDIMRIDIHRIYDAVYSGKLFYSNTYMSSDKSPVVQTDVNGQYIAEFCTITTASKETQIPYTNIVSCLNSGKHYSGGYLWFYKSDYYSSNFTLPKKIRRRKEDFNIRIEKYDLNWNYIQTYDNAYVAASDNNTRPSRILDAIEGKQTKCVNFYWKKSA